MTQATDQITAERLKKLGLTKAGDTLHKKQDLKRRAAVAYEFFRVATPEVIDQFARRLKQRTLRILHACPKCHGKGREHLFHSDSEAYLEKMKKDAQRTRFGKSADNCDYCQRTGALQQVFDEIRFTMLEEYGKIPPEPCLAQLERAHQRNCFDWYEVADISTVVQRPDPIIFGRINGCDDRFFVTQWDTDIDINDILNQK